MKQEKYVAYVGTYTHENSVGIHIYDVDVEAGKLTERVNFIRLLQVGLAIFALSGILYLLASSVFHCG